MAGIQDKFKGDGLTKLLKRLLKHWYLFVLFVGIAMAMAWAVNKYTLPVYRVQSSLYIKPGGTGKQSSSSEISLLNADRMLNRSKDLNKEFLVLKSFSNVYNSLKPLDFDISYYNVGSVNTIELYPRAPIEVQVDTSSKRQPQNTLIQCKVIDKQTYELVTDHPHWQTVLNNVKRKFDEQYDVNGFVFTITLKEVQAIKNQKDIPAFKINNPETLANQYRRRINVTQIYKESTLLNVSINSKTPNKDIEYLNHYMDYIVEKGLEDKVAYAVKTIDFLEDQISHISDSLDMFGNKLEELKVRNWDLGNSEIIFEKIRDLEERKTDVSLSIRYLEYLKGYVKKKDTDEPFAPHSLGIEDASVSNLYKRYIESRYESGLAKSDANIENPRIISKERESKFFEKNFIESIENQREFNKQTLKEIQEEVNENLAAINGLLNEEREIQKLQSFFDINQQLYMTLLRKRLEVNLAKVSTTSDYEVLDYARVVAKLKPQTDKNYQLAVIGGLFFPIIIVVLFHLMDNKVHHRSDIQNNTNVPFLGYVAHSTRLEELVVKSDPMSPLAESFRAIRTNLKYFLREKMQSSMVMVITSTVSGEGKTFTAMNLSYIMAVSGKRTIVIGGDLRRPKLFENMDVEHKSGLSNYLAGDKKLDDIIQHTDHDGLDLITAGEIPPNPSELLMTEALEQLIKALKKRYDLIIFDSSPVGLVTDAFELIKYADASLFIVRQDYTRLAALTNLEELYTTGKIKNVSVILNDMKKETTYGYGYGYSYGQYSYTQDKSKAKSIKRFLKPWTTNK